MKVDIASQADLRVLWSWITAEPEIHMEDSSPLTFEEFAAGLSTESIVVFAIWKGRKLAGCVGVQHNPIAGDSMFRGIHFIPEVRGTTFPKEAVASVLALLFSHGSQAVIAKYPASNLRVHKFLAKLGFVCEGMDGEYIRGGQSVPRLKAVFHADTSTTD